MILSHWSCERTRVIPCIIHPVSPTCSWQCRRLKCRTTSYDWGAPQWKSRVFINYHLDDDDVTLIHSQTTRERIHTHTPRYTRSKHKVTTASSFQHQKHTERVKINGVRRDIRPWNHEIYIYRTHDENDIYPVASIVDTVKRTPSGSRSGESTTPDKTPHTMSNIRRFGWRKRWSCWACLKPLSTPLH